MQNVRCGNLVQTNLNTHTVCENAKKTSVQYVVNHTCT